MIIPLVKAEHLIFLLQKWNNTIKLAQCQLKEVKEVPRVCSRGET